MKAVIMAGGRGTRISSIAKDIPKPMIQIDGKPILEYEILNLKEQGFHDFIITVSYLGEVIMDYFKEGTALGVNIEYFVEKEPLGNAGALFKIRERLPEDFFLLNADAVFDLDFQRMIDFHYNKGGLVTLFTHPNSHPYDSGLIFTDNNNCVTQWAAKEDDRPEFYKNRVNAGIHIISPKILEQEIHTSKVDLDRQLLKPLAGTGKMYAYDSPEYVKDMGTPERYAVVCEDYRTGKIKAKNLWNKQKAVFLDRDGVINRYVGFLTDIDDFELLEGVEEAVKEINQSGYLVIVVTNQPVVARGEVTFQELDKIHHKMETLLGEKGAYLDDIYFCPHHPKRGFEGEVSELKVECECRKPKPGMLLEAAEKYNIDLAQSFMVGDSENDILAGKATGCKTVLIGTENYKQDKSYASLLDFVEREIPWKDNQREG